MFVDAALLDPLLTGVWPAVGITSDGSVDATGDDPKRFDAALAIGRRGIVGTSSGMIFSGFSVPLIGAGAVYCPCEDELVGLNRGASVTLREFGFVV
jgi:hypothetical protein